MKKEREKKISQIVGLLTVFIIFASLALGEGKLLGHKFTHSAPDDTYTQQENTVIINTSALGEKITGYAGNTPLEIYITEGVIDSVVPLPNEETPGFFSRLEKGGLFKTWKGVPASKAATMDVDAISGATFSSKAVIENVKTGCRDYVKSHGGDLEGGKSGNEWSVKTVVVLLVILTGAIIPIFIKKRPYRIAQQLLNTGVLGFWGGTFVDYAMMKGFFVNGYSASAAATHILLFVALIYPILGQSNHYCNWICPYGSLQELAGHLSKKKLHIEVRTQKFLEYFRQCLWTILTAFLFIGWGMSWIDYEIFTAFIVESASTAVIIVAALFLILSIFVARPFCRFVCPTGSMLKILK